MLSTVQQSSVNDLILSVGGYIKNERTIFDVSRVQLKDVHDLVSYVDKQAEEKLINGLMEIVPGSSVLAEESGEKSLSSEYRWIIDPLDGTTNFIHGIPHYCISVACEVNSIISYGWVFEIAGDELFTASIHGGAFMNGQKIQCSHQEKYNNSLIATGFPVKNYRYLDNYLQLQKWMIENTRGIRRLGTAAYDLCLVASGKVDAYFEPGLNAWDVAAGSLIVMEAGGKVSDFAGGKDFIDGKQILASNSYIHADIIREIQRCQPL